MSPCEFITESQRAPHVPMQLSGIRLECLQHNVRVFWLPADGLKQGLEGEGDQGPSDGALLLSASLKDLSEALGLSPHPCPGLGDTTLPLVHIQTSGDTNSPLPRPL